MTKFRVAILARNDQQAKFMRSLMRLREDTVSVLVFTTARQLLSHEKFHMIIECDYFFQHPDAKAIREIANDKLV